VATDSYGQSVPYPTLSEAPDAETGFEGLVNAMVPRSNMRFASASARNATLTSPTAGMVAYLVSEKQLTIYDGSSWKGIFFGDTDWGTYNPVWSATTTNPALGNGQIFGSYTKVGKSCQVVIMLTIGSTTNKGSGTYKLSLPFTTANNACPGVLTATFSRGGTPNHGIGDSSLLGNATTTDLIWLPNPGVAGDSNIWTNEQPWTLATGDRIRLYGTYQTAS
jgi:hypothetical protein